MPALLKPRHVLVGRLPVIGNDDDPALGRELPRDVRRSRVSASECQATDFSSSVWQRRMSSRTPVRSE